MRIRWSNTGVGRQGELLRKTDAMAIGVCLLLLTEVSGSSELSPAAVRIISWPAWQAGQEVPGTPLENEFPRGRRNGV
jgi:hypothetical protein